MKIKCIAKEILLYIKALCKNNQVKIERYKVLSIEDTLKVILAEQKSAVRIGDGEILLMNGINQDHQVADSRLSSLLRESVQDMDGLIVCIPEMYDSCKNIRFISAIHWKTIIRNNWEEFHSIMPLDREYGNAFITRPYLVYKKKSVSAYRFKLLKQIWNNRNVLIIEGQYSCTGVGNDLLSNAKSIKRIICPGKNAFSVYDKLLDYLFNDTDLDSFDLILVALGATAKPLVVELAKNNVWAIDIGHIDSEYEWFLMNAKDRVVLEKKHTADCEVEGIADNTDANYQQSIIKKFVEQ